MKYRVYIAMFSAVGALTLVGVMESSWAETSPKQSAEARCESSKGAPAEPDSIDKIRSELRAGKTQLIANNITFPSDAASKDFWKIYSDYEKEMITVGDSQLGLIRDYARQYEGLTDQQARQLTTRSLEIRENSLALRRRYVEKISSEISPLVAAQFLQVEAAVQSIVDAEIATNVPMIRTSTVR